jgi:hypothetical protein
MTLPLPTLDHVVINARDEMDAAAETYRRLGFQLTPRGYHTLGSMNHLAMFGTDYLELIAIPKGATTGRLDLLNYPSGFNGLVFGTEDSAATYKAVTASGAPIEPPQEFSRPVELPEGKRDATFRTVRFKAEVVPAGRVYFCHHLTRDLVWRDEWRHHDNGAVAVARTVIADENPKTIADLFRKMFGNDALRPVAGGETLVIGNARCDVITPAELKRQFGAACPDAHGRSSYMAALSFRTTSLDRAAKTLAARGIKGVQREAGRLVVPAAEAINATLEFVE